MRIGCNKLLWCFVCFQPRLQKWFLLTKVGSIEDGLREDHIVGISFFDFIVIFIVVRLIILSASTRLTWSLARCESGRRSIRIYSRCGRLLQLIPSQYSSSPSLPCPLDATAEIRCSTCKQIPDPLTVRLQNTSGLSKACQVGKLAGWQSKAECT